MPLPGSRAYRRLSGTKSQTCSRAAGSLRCARYRAPACWPVRAQRGPRGAPHGCWAPRSHHSPLYTPSLLQHAHGGDQKTSSGTTQAEPLQTFLWGGLVPLFPKRQHTRGCRNSYVHQSPRSSCRRGRRPSQRRPGEGDRSPGHRSASVRGHLEAAVGTQDRKLGLWGDRRHKRK